MKKKVYFLYKRLTHGNYFFDSRQMADEMQVAAVMCCGVATITARIIRLVRNIAKSEY